MERIRQMKLKKALFTIALINITAALILSLLVNWGCVELRSQISPPGSISVDVHSDSPVIIACLLATAIPLRAIAKMNIVESIEAVE